MSPPLRRRDPRPPAAWWSEGEQEWVEGPRDAEGRLHGRIRYWDAEGRFISECEHVQGLPHGRAQRFYADGSLAQECTYVQGRIEGVRTCYRPGSPRVGPLRPLDNVAPVIAVYECVYEQGNLLATRFRDAAGAEVNESGVPIPPRPPGVSPLASPMPGGEWVEMRRRGENGDEVLGMRLWYRDGQLREEKREDGYCRSFHPTGAPSAEGQRVRKGKYNQQDGLWRHGDAVGVVRRESIYELGVELVRTLRRPLDEAGPGGAGGVMRTGPVGQTGGNADACECGRWELRDGDGAVLRAVDLGEPVADGTLLEDAALSDDADEAALGRRVEEGALGAGARIARLRLAGRSGRVEALLALAGPGPAWTHITRDGEVLPLIHWRARLGELVLAMEWGVPASEALGELAARLFRAGRPRAALDLVDAARLTSDAPALREARIAYLRALGRDDEALRELEAAHPDRVGPREEALLLGLRDAPDDKGKWLTYAEAIEGTRPAPAALIRSACGTSEAGWLEALLTALRDVLPDEVGEAINLLSRGSTVSSMVWTPAEQFLAHHDALFRAAPLATELFLEDATDAMAQLATLPALRRYTALSFTDTLLFDGGAAHLARSPHLGQLVHLGLRGTHLHDEDLEAILGSLAFPRLTSLDISNDREGQSYGLDGLRALTEAAFAGTLEDFTLERRWLGDSVVSVLAALPRLQSLGLEGGALGDAGALALAALPRRWIRLDLRWNELGARGASALMDAPMAGSLEELDLSRNALGSEGVMAVAAAPLVRLRRLDLGDNGLGDEGALALARSPHLAALEWLQLGRVDVSPETREALRARFGARVRLEAR
ncbi:hypothetical protein [Pyxidicoccus trucidator]|uniref:hypothetical protein n=1 Tax=Pyxidicoccus trucidator TaxID=2709662 RepID=UPI0013DAB0C7|nr:hypothetical protein [Pyxidicoccus trucidator]